METFRTYVGDLVTGERLQAALNAVAEDWAQMATAIRREDAYASHVTDAEKDEILERDLAFSEAIRRGEATGFTIWQRINTALTGECVPLFRPEVATSVANVARPTAVPRPRNSVTPKSVQFSLFAPSANGGGE